MADLLLLVLGRFVTLAKQTRQTRIQRRVQELLTCLKTPVPLFEMLCRLCHCLGSAWLILCHSCGAETPVSRGPHAEIMPLWWLLSEVTVISGRANFPISLQLPRAVGTQALSGAGILKMFNKATDAVSKMTIKMNESDIVSIWIPLGCPCPSSQLLVRGARMALQPCRECGNQLGVSVHFSGSRRSCRRWSARNSGYGSCTLLWKH